LVESNEINNASFSWGTIGINALASSSAGALSSPAAAASAPMTPGEAYNGKRLPPANAPMGKLRISNTPLGGRRVELDPAGAPLIAVPSRAAASRPSSKVMRPRQQVIFPSNGTQPMPKNN
jgi:hypothetical protein